MILKKLKIGGVIIPNDYQDVYDWFGLEATSPQKVAAFLADANGEDVTLEINSGGGEVTSGSEIYTLLKSYNGRTIAEIMGMAASAASIIAIGCSLVTMSPTAMFMIHNVATVAEGDYRALEKEANVCKNFNQSLANAYRLKTGKSEAELLSLMDQETWLTAQKAKELGFVDEIMFDKENLLVASIGNILPIEAINKVKNILAEQKNEKENKEKAQTLAVEAERIALLSL